MSINRIYQNTNELEFEKYNFIISKFSMQIKNAIDIEKQIINEGHVIEYIDSLEDLIYEELSEFSQFRSRDFILNENKIKDSLDLSRLQCEILRKRFLSYYNESQIIVNGLIGKIKRIKQKQAAIDLWDDNYIKYVVSEKFRNFDNLDFNFVSGNKLNVETDQGVLTLPIEKESILEIKNISITSGNGNAGNSDVEVSYNSSKLSNITDNNINTWFEYERLDNGPVRLNLTVELDDESIINYIEIVPYLIDGHFNIKDIKYSGNSRDYKSIKDLTLVENDAFYTPKILDSGNLWNINFLPIKTKSFTLVLEGNFASYIKVAGANGTFTRKRFSIGIREMKVKKIKYSTQGSINSSQINLLENCYVGESQIKVIPENTNLYSMDFDISTDGGTSWNAGTDKTFLVEDEKKLVYKLNLKRENNSFSTSSTFSKEEDNSYLKVKTKVCSKKISPNVITINEKTTEDDIFVYQPTGVNLSSKYEKTKVIFRHKRLNSKIFNPVPLYASKPTIRIPLNLNLSDYNILPKDIEIYLDDELLSEVQSINDLNQQEDTYYIEEDFSFIILHKERVEYGSRIKFKLKPEELNFMKREKEYLCKFNNLFNPNKSKIDIECLSGRRKSYVENINKNRNVFKLNRRGIIKDSISFTNDINMTFQGVEKKEDVKTESNTIGFHVNERKSLIHLPRMNFEGVVNIEYKANEIFEVEEKDYKIWFEEGIPKGIIISEDNFVSEDVEEKLELNASFAKKFSLREHYSYAREDRFPGHRRAFTLSNKNIVSGTVRLSPEVFGKQKDYDISPIEVPFLDGESEFLNLKKSLNEKTISIISDSNGFVKFKLAAGALWYPKLSIEFEGSEFITPVSSLSQVNTYGEYFVDKDGNVTLKIDPTTLLEEEKNISYYYTNKTASEKYKFSVDYNEGILYLSENINLSDNSKIFYKTSNYVAGYEIVDKIKNFVYNKKSKRIEIDSGYISDKSNTIGTAYLVKDIKITLEEMKDYFTPFIDRIDFRFK